MEVQLADLTGDQLCRATTNITNEESLSVLRYLAGGARKAQLRLLVTSNKPDWNASLRGDPLRELKAVCRITPRAREYSTHCRNRVELDDFHIAVQNVQNTLRGFWSQSATAVDAVTEARDYRVALKVG